MRSCWLRIHSTVSAIVRSRTLASQAALSPAMSTATAELQVVLRGHAEVMAGEAEARGVGAFDVRPAHGIEADGEIGQQAGKLVAVGGGDGDVLVDGGSAFEREFVVVGGCRRNEFRGKFLEAHEAGVEAGVDGFDVRRDHVERRAEMALEPGRSRP